MKISDAIQTTKVLLFAVGSERVKKKGKKGFSEMRVDIGEEKHVERK